MLLQHQPIQAWKLKSFFFLNKMKDKLIIKSL